MKPQPTYAEIYDFENLLKAYKKSRKNHAYQPSSLRYHAQFEERLINLQNHLIWKSWQPGRAEFFTVTDPKMREITAPPFKDRVLHHALHQVIEPSFERRFIFDSYACRTGKGVYQAAGRLQHLLRKAKREIGSGFYVIKCDIKSYFASIDHDILLKQFAKVIHDPGLQGLFARALKSYGFDNGIGMPVGALTSQLSGNIMLDPLDHRIKDDWGYKYYLRYMDDFVLLVKDKQAALKALDAIETEVNSLGLRLNPKSDYFPWQRGVDFCGYRIWPTHRLPRKRTVKRARKRIAKMIKRYQNNQSSYNEVKAAIFSFMAYMNRCDARISLDEILKESVISKKST